MQNTQVERTQASDRMTRTEDREAWTKHVTKQQIAKSIAGAKRSKYGAVKTAANGKQFDSAKEAKRYLELAMLQAAKEIVDLECQTSFEIGVNPILGGSWIKVGEWRADFTYRRLPDPRMIVEDVKSKGTRTAVYRLKKKLVEALYGITILET